MSFYDDSDMKGDDEFLDTGARIVGFFQRGPFDGYWLITRNSDRVCANVEFTHLKNRPNLPLFYQRDGADIPAEGSLNPFHLLPNELLLKIFFDYVAQCRADPSAYALGKNPFPHLNLAHVCHRWRELVLTTPSFWTQVDTRSIEMVEMTLTFSKNRDLYVRIREPVGPNRQPLMNWFVHMAPDKNRIKHIEYAPTLDDSKHQLQSFAWLVHNAKNLTSVTYFASAPAAQPVHVMNTGIPLRPPPVRYLSIYGPQGASALTSLFATSLTHLYICGYYKWDRHTPTATAEVLELTSAFMSAVNVTHLELVELNFGANHVRDVSHVLPKLKVLRIVDTSTSITVLLRTMHFPATAALVLECKESLPLRLRSNMTSTIGSKLLGEDQLSDPVAYTALTLDVYPNPVVRAYTATGLCTFEFSFVGVTKPSLDVLHVLDRLLHDISPAMHAVKTLTVGAYAPSSPASHPDEVEDPSDLVWKALERLHAVETLTLSRCTNAVLHRLLSGAAAGADASFPKLKHALVSSCAFASTSCDCGQHPNKPPPEMGCPTVVYDTVGVRGEKGLERLERLDLRDPMGLCACNRERMRALAKTYEEFPVPRPYQVIEGGGVAVGHGGGGLGLTLG